MASAFVPQGSGWVWPLLALSAFAVVSALGARRAVLVLALVYIGVTAVTEAMVWWRIQDGTLLPYAAYELDTGPSFVVVAAMVVAIGCARPLWWRAVWLLLLGAAAPDLLAGLADGEVAAAGHVLAALAGLAVVLTRRLRCRRPAAQPTREPVLR
ncbi:hypothetical protein [Streptomyces kaniharaensis]|uniref:hypothetical protein n=1 Tax=Streptomyces kaniharaensis TaxID=212423 RepID=UPI0018A88367|nr:hypothetical protein [Streptomyces kaniharaensis]